MKAEIHVMLKQEVLDPQGDAVRRALHSLGFNTVRDVRVGKLIEIQMDGKDEATEKMRLEDMCRKLLANAVIEDFRVRIVEGK